MEKKLGDTSGACQAAQEGVELVARLATASEAYLWTNN